MVAFGLLGIVWSVLAPLMEAPDEPDHLALVLYLADAHGYPAYDGLQSPDATYRLCRTYASANRACPRRGETFTATSTRRHPVADAPPRASRPAWNDLGGSKPVGRLNQMPQHPPLYYEAMATVLRVERAVHGGPLSLDRELALLRLVNALMLAPLPLIAWWGARRFGLDDAAATAAALVPFGIPMLTHIGSTLNNDNLLNLAGAVVIALLAGVVRGDRSLRTAALVGVATGIALLSKASAVIFPPIVVLAYVIAWRASRAPAARPGASTEAWETGRRQGRPILASARPLCAAGAVTAAVAAWWYVGNWVRTGSFAPTIEDRRFGPDLAPAGFHPHLGAFASTFLRSVNGRFWGSFGWYSVRFSAALGWVATAVVVAAVVSALATRVVPGFEARTVGEKTAKEEDPGTARGADPTVTQLGVPGRLGVAFLLTPVVALAVFVAVRAYGLYATTSQFIFLQGRYLFAGIAGLAVVVAVGVRRVAGRATVAAVGVSAGALQVWALHRASSGFWGGPGLGPRGQYRAMAAYSGWPAGVVAGFVIFAAVSALALVWQVLAEARQVGSNPP